MSKRNFDAEITNLLRALPETAAPPMAPLRLPPRPVSPPRLPWRAGEVLLLLASAALGLGGLVWLAVSGPGVVAAQLVQALLGAGSIGGTLIATAFAAAVGWCVVVFAAPRAA